MSGFDAFAYFSGAWDFKRSIDLSAHVIGKAVFKLHGKSGDLSYSEEGLLLLADHTRLRAQRNYIYRRRKNGFEVFFAEDPPRIFQAVDLFLDEGKMRGEAIHFCGDDTYESSYAILSEDSFSVSHYVKGSRKSYASLTVYKRNSLR
jgi:hypothetical protein